MNDNMRNLLSRLDSMAEDISAQQREVGQLPALFKPGRSLPSSDGHQKNVTRGYLVGEDSNDNAMRQAVTRRIVNQHPEWITRYGVEFLMQAIDDVTEGEDDWEEIGSSDVSAFVDMVGDRLRDTMGSREEVADRRPFAEGPESNIVATNPRTERIIQQLRINNPHAGSDLEALIYDYRRSQRQDRDDIARLGQENDIEDQEIERLEADLRRLKQQRRQPRRDDVLGEQTNTTEDMVSAVKRSLGDYLQDLTKTLKQDDDLKEPRSSQGDTIKAVKTIRTDDGHEIKIHGNEDDGFRISIRERDIPSRFATMNEAEMATEMYCARRREREMARLQDDYIDEK